MAFVLIIPRKSGVNAGLGAANRALWLRWLESGLFIARDDRHRLAPPIRFGRSFFQDLDFTIDAQNLGHLLFKLGVAVLKIVLASTLCGLISSLPRILHTVPSTKNWPNRRALPPARARAHGVPAAASSTTRADSHGPWPCRRPAIQPSLGLRRDHRLLPRSRPVIKCRQRAIGHSQFDAALHRLMMNPQPSTHREERRCLTIALDDICARATRLARSVREREIAPNCPTSSSFIASSIACRHPAMMPLLVLPIANGESTNQRLVPSSRLHGIDRLVYNYSPLLTLVSNKRILPQNTSLCGLRSKIK